MSDDNWGYRIKKTRQLAGISQAEFGNMLNVSVATINRIENNHSVPDAGLISKIASKFDVSVEYLLLGKSEDKHKNIEDAYPVFSESDIIAGKFQEMTSDSWAKIPQVQEAEKIFLLITKELGMRPTIEPGDMLMISQDMPEPSNIVVFLDNSGVVSVRKLGRTSNGDEFFVAENPEYPRLRKNDEIIIGKVVGGLRYYKT
ncbi:XRE family transcriptional regulator [Desulfonatronovibrio magnus]|uniref:XRE family transcriptional regulator n=1 Tax=Desulfonatronovibrio magnus TaxID=698827 RepID=UPI00069623CB|nr:XRE family transcriptional regulator [Desulfonatronovibrio magnus]